MQGMQEFPGLGNSPGVGDGIPLRYSYLKNPMDRGAWQTAVHGVAELDMTERAHTHTHTTSDFLLLSSTVLWLHTSRCYFNFLKQFDFFFFNKPVTQTNIINLQILQLGFRGS